MEQSEVRYQDLGRLDESKEIYLMRDMQTGLLYVRKTISLQEEDVFERLRQARLPGIPAIRELVDNGNGTCTVIEEYIQGMTLQQIMEREGRLTEKRIRSLMISLCRILEPVHKMDPPIIHRDIKPSNIIVTQSGQVYLLDFGAARQYDVSNEFDTRYMGTAEFAAPEQYGFRQTDVRTDIYNIGTTMNFLLTGSNPRSLPEDKGLGRVIRRCMEMDPAERYQNLTELEKALSGKPGHFVPWLPVGFRSLHPVKILAAAVFYAFGILLIWSPHAWDHTTKPTAYAVYMTVTTLGMVAIAGNYGGIWNWLPGMRRRTNLRWLALLGNLSGWILLSLIVFSIYLLWVG